ncbi:MAG: cation transporter [Planctomycetes bacterium]|nr:cation transporter [Planctomycetota bacterium]
MSLLHAHDHGRDHAPGSEPAQGHGPAHSHGHGGSAFAWGIGLNAIYIVVELGAGWYADSLALLSDALHNLSDVVALGVAWFAATLARRKPSAHRTYGFTRATILSALFSSALLCAAMGVIAWESLHRLLDPRPVDGGVVALVAAFGVLINTATALFLAKERERDLNIRSVWLNMMADAGLSALVALAGVAIALTGWHSIDAAASFVLALAILVLAASVLRDALNLATDAVPRGIDPAEVRELLTAQPGVREVHDLHIWPLGTTHIALTAHLVMPEPPASDTFLRELNAELLMRFGIDHTAIQVERGDGPGGCPDAAADRI